MENRLPLRPSSRVSSARSSTPQQYSDRERDYEHRYGAISRSSLASSILSRTTSTASRTTTGESSRSHIAHATDEENVFATPVNSRPGSSVGSFLVADGFGGRRRSFDEHSRDSMSIGVADGGRPSCQHSISYSSISTRSQTPSLRSDYTGPTLNRSNTTGTTNSSTLYSIPSHLSQISSPPSPLQEIAPVRPRFDYSGHQQTLSIGASDLGDGDPFGDDYMMPVGDGFAPHRQENYMPARMIRPESTGSTVNTLPPPYSQYPHQLPKPVAEEGATVATGLAVNRDPGATITNRGSPAPDHSPPIIAESNATGDTLVPHRGHEADDSGAVKEWKEKKFGGPRVWLLIAAALLVGLAVGLGTGLGIGLHHKTASSAAATVTATADIAPAPEKTTEATFESGSFPQLPIGPSVISPLRTQISSNTCELFSVSPSMPEFFKAGAPSLWSCKIPEAKPLLWNFVPLPPNLSGAQLSTLKSDPKPLSHAEYDDGRWGGYVVTSKEGEDEHKDHIVFVDQRGEVIQYAGKPGWREGMQGPAFWRQPLTYINETIRNNTNDHVPVDESYRFGILYTKRVLMRESTLKDNYYAPVKNTAKYGGDGSKLKEGEIAWMCEWDNTLLEVEILVDYPSLGGGDPNVDAGAQMAYAGLDTLFDLDSLPTTVTIGLTSEPPPTPVAEQPPPPAATATTPTNYYRPDPGVSADSPKGDLPDLPSFPPAPGLPGAALNFTYPIKRSESSSNDDDNINNPDSDSSPAASRTTNNNNHNHLHRNKPRGDYSYRNIRSYPLRTRITEYPPSIWRLKDVQGIDRTEGDNDLRARPGDVKCTKVIVTPGGGLRTDKGADGEGYVVFKQKAEKRGESMKSGCGCMWSS